MSLPVTTNLASLNAQRNGIRAQNDLSTAIARLSSGLRINSARDDAAGLAISDHFTSQVRGIGQASRNVNDGISLAQTAEGSLASVVDNLQRIRELSVQSANAANSASDRSSLQLEVAQLVSEIDRVATQARFNGINLLDGSFTAKAFQVGAGAGQTITMDAIASMRSGALGIHRGFTYVDPWLGPWASNTASMLTVSIGGGAPIDLGVVPLDSKAQSDAINAAGIRGLHQVANATLMSGTVSSAAATQAGVATITLNGVTIPLSGVDGGAALAGNRASAVAAINAQSAVTGVSASDTGSAVDLHAPDGRNISLTYAPGSFANSARADFGLPSASIMGATPTMTYVAPPGVSGSVVFARPGGQVSIPIGTTGTSISALDISTVEGANIALGSIEAALETVNSARASLGAVQNRFGSTIVNLQVTRENLAASRSRIQDADFAHETANLSRAQVLQQAGTAMIAQANQLPGQVLQLLR